MTSAILDLNAKDKYQYAHFYFKNNLLINDNEKCNCCYPKIGAIGLIMGET
jgi:hypothetical protein